MGNKIVGRLCSDSKQNLLVYGVSGLTPSECCLQPNLVPLVAEIHIILLYNVQFIINFKRIENCTIYKAGYSRSNLKSHLVGLLVGQLAPLTLCLAIKLALQLQSQSVFMVVYVAQPKNVLSKVYTKCNQEEENGSIVLVTMDTSHLYF